MTSAAHPDLLFVAGPGGSGTTLLRDLLDSHPQLAVWPNEWPYLSLYRQHVSRDLAARLLLDRIVADLLADTRKFRPVYELTPADSRPPYPVARLDQLNPGFPAKLAARGQESLNAREAYLAVAQAFLWDPAQTMFCNKSNEPSWLHDYLSQFPTARFVFIIRHPVDVYLSKLRRRARGYSLAPEVFSHSVFSRSYQEIRAFHQTLSLVEGLAGKSPRHFCLRMEDLLAEPAAWLARLAAFLEVEDHPNLHRPTYFGQEVMGNLNHKRPEGRDLLPPAATIDREAGLTRQEKKWFLAIRALFEPHYPDLEEDLTFTPETGLEERSRDFFAKYWVKGEMTRAREAEFQEMLQGLAALQP
ncbi:MAG: sulfotransferase [Deltaproteobacteria bacterium]|nr:sulfotransferase [Deltaproteobacteria bacterium]